MNRMGFGKQPSSYDTLYGPSKRNLFKIMLTLNNNKSYVPDK